MYVKVGKMLHEVADSNCMLMGDFNYRNINWRGNVCESCASVDTKMFMDCVQDLFLTRHVNCLTTDRSVLDLVLSKEPDLVYDVRNLGKLANSDHNWITWNVNIKGHEQSTTRVSYNYRAMDVNGAKKELKLVDWQSEFVGSVDEVWGKFKNRLLQLRDKYVPRFSHTKKKKELWLTNKAIKSIRQKHRVYRRHKDSKHPACIKATKRAKMEVKKARLNFEKKLADSIKTDTKSFFAYVKSKSKAKVNVGPLLDSNGHSIDSSEEMSREFNEFFASVFTEEESGAVPEAKKIFNGREEEEFFDIVITEAMIVRKLEGLRDDKAGGADELVPRFLNKIKEEISFPLLLIFNMVLDQE